jgi:hypothetical protein
LPVRSESSLSHPQNNGWNVSFFGKNFAAAERFISVKPSEAQRFIERILRCNGNVRLDACTFPILACIGIERPPHRQKNT